MSVSQDSKISCRTKQNYNKTKGGKEGGREGRKEGKIQEYNRSCKTKKKRTRRNQKIVRHRSIWIENSLFYTERKKILLKIFHSC